LSFLLLIHLSLAYCLNIPEIRSSLFHFNQTSVSFEWFVISTDVLCACGALTLFVIFYIHALDVPWR